MAGNKYGRLEVMEYSHTDEDHAARWKCKCDCGKIVFVSGTKLRTGNTRSCGCLQREGMATRSREYHRDHRGNKSKSTSWKGYGDISATFFNSLKRKAVKRKIIFALTIEYIWELFLKQDGKCALTGVPIMFSPSVALNATRTASLDRIDSKQGYVVGNVQWVQKEINFMKQQYTTEHFIELCKQVLDYHKQL